MLFCEVQKWCKKEIVLDSGKSPGGRGIREGISICATPRDVSWDNYLEDENSHNFKF